ncbi:diguanylate cyclase [Desulfuromonas soudanensis]|uniref:Diguanylate cyclase n=1 Tax=Desulfuromonas soudanensis TaxID=1603606 RepID=A0A0M3QFS9_9BACT|nr:GGDEF domain-containing response regulator [Desulfuromonas soudanensis]ALC16759.1 diguanylate cyclase [Desulfuromonas soudanensis]
MTDLHLKILLVDDDEDDFLITRDLLEEIEGVRFDLEWVSTYDEGVQRAEAGEHQVYLCDYRLGERDGLELLRELIGRGCKAPIILLTGQGDREVDVEAMKAGAADYLVKGQLTAPLLDRSIRYSLEHCRSEQKLAYLAEFDTLTGLPNRMLFMDRLHQALAQAHREDKMLGLLFLDLDRFKIINDTLGHSVGDALLKTVAERLSEAVRASDTVARLGGDEFVAILSGLEDTKGASLVAGRILKAMARPFLLDQHEVFISASIGIALFPFDAGDVEGLIKHADSAMYQAKSSGGNTFKFYSMEMNAKAMERLTLESSLHRAQEREEFVLHYQPQFEVVTGKLVGMEALLRWQPPAKELVPPGEFISLLEENGLIVSVGEWVLRTACEQIRDWEKAGFRTVPVAVNLSGRQLRQPGFCSVVGRILKETGVSAGSLVLELTESIMMQYMKKNIEILREFKEMGIGLAIDDFGTGYSSLSCLKYFPLDWLKIDRSFIAQLHLNQGDEAISRAIIAMAHSLGMRVIAEGVETEDQMQFLRDNRCDEVQGFYLGRPLPAAGAESFLTTVAHCA